MSEGEIHVGELDASATLAMDELMALAGQMDVEIDASQVMSKAIRMYFWIVAGGVTVTPTKPALAAVMVDATLGGTARH